MSGHTNDYRQDLRNYVIGLALALLLTAAAFATVIWRIAPGPVSMGIVFGLGLVQIVVHFRFFLHIDLSESVREDLQLILFSTLIILMMAGGTLVVLMNLRHRMM
jgi:cytochrome o ubiquinol oxidase operon protein cyoD